MRQGVKGRPAACLTCRRRKKGCDLQRPSCGQCRKACIPCAGYTNNASRSDAATAAAEGAIHDRNATYAAAGIPAERSDAGSSGLPATPYGIPLYWPGSEVSTPTPPFEYGLGIDPFILPPVFSSPLDLPVRQRTTIQSLPPHHVPGIDHPRSSDQSLQAFNAHSLHSHNPYNPSQSEDKERLQRLHRLKQQRLLIQKQQQRGLKDLVFSGSVSRSAEDDRLIGCFWEAYLPNSQPLPQTEFHIHFGGSVETVREYSKKSLGIHKALLALGITTLGKSIGAKSMINTGFRVYGEALEHTAKALTRRDMRAEEQLLRTRILCLFESLYGTEVHSHTLQRGGYMAHNSGDTAIILSNPPSAYKSGFAHILFTSGRLQLALYGLLLRKRVFLTDPDWMTIPWTEIPRTPRDFLVDILLDLPSMVEGFDAMSMWDDPKKKEIYRRLLQRALRNMTDRLLEWHTNYAIDFLPSSLEGPLPEKLSHEDLTNNHLMSLFWAAMIRTYEKEVALLSPGEHIDDRIDPEHSCRNLIRAIRIFAHRSAGMFRHHLAPFPISTALQYLSHIPPDRLVREREVLWESLRSPTCPEVLQFIMSMEPTPSEEE